MDVLVAFDSAQATTLYWEVILNLFQDLLTALALPWVDQ